MNIRIFFLIIASLGMIMAGRVLAAPLDIVDCAKMEDSDEINACYMNVAIGQKDVVICEYISDLKDRNSCRVAVLQAEPVLPATQHRGHAEGILRAMSAAAENYARFHGGKYPSDYTDLTKAKPAFINENYCDKELEGYFFTCSFSKAGYRFIAKLLGPESHEISIATGGIMMSVTKADQERKKKGWAKP